MWHNTRNPETFPIRTGNLENQKHFYTFETKLAAMKNQMQIIIGGYIQVYPPQKRKMKTLQEKLQSCSSVWGGDIKSDERGYKKSRFICEILKSIIYFGH